MALPKLPKVPGISQIGHLELHSVKPAHAEMNIHRLMKMKLHKMHAKGLLKVAKPKGKFPSIAKFKKLKVS